jgi:predicted DNA-binding transcriptional regulator AlpA
MQSDLQLPGPRIWRPSDLATFLGFSIHWVYKQTKSNSADPPPRCLGLSRLRFDTHSKEFREWLARQIEPPSSFDTTSHEQV